MSSRQRRPREIQASLFDQPPAYVPPRRPPRAVSELAHMVRHPDHDTSIDAADQVVSHRTRIQNMILKALEIHGPMNDGELELLPEFADCAETTVSKRRTELTQKEPPLVVYAGIRRPNPKNPKSGMKVWKLA